MHAYTIVNHTWISLLGEKVSEKNFISSRDWPIKGQKQGMDEETQEHHLLRNDEASSLASKQGWENTRRLPYICKKMGSRCRVVFLRSLIPTWRPKKRPPSFFSRWCYGVFLTLLCSAFFIGPSLLEMKFFQNLFPWFLFFFGGF